MSAELLSRVQFALTASFHFIYPPISMGLGLLLVIIGYMHVRTKDPKWREMSVFWIKIFGLCFAIGVATGLVQEFEFGMNWANYSRFVGNVFGSLLAAEGIFAFFLEGGFLGLMLFGGSRLGPRMWLTATILTVFGSYFSALWIIMANSWMQTPAGYVIQQTPNGSMAYMTDFLSVVFTPSFLARLFHVLVASLLVGSSLMLSVSAWYLIKGRHTVTATSAVKVALPIFAVMSVLQPVVFGTWMALVVTAYQPIKLAGMEGAWPASQACAPLYLFGWVDQASQTTHGIAVPCLLSFLAYGNINAPVAGLQAFQSSLWPPLQLSFQAYHLMIDAGMLFPLIALIAVVAYFWGRRLFRTHWILWVLVLSVFLTEVATLSGWWTAEFGRQPWVVYNLLQTDAGHSPTLGTAQVVFSLGTFFVLYAGLFALFIFLLNERIHRGPEPVEGEAPTAPLPDTFREIFSRRAPMAGR